MSNRYVPSPVPNNTENLASYLQEELKRIAEATNNISDGHLDKAHVEPPRPRAGDIRYADGSDWNPGQGENLYYFNGTIWRAYAGGSGAGDFAQIDDTTTHTASSADTPTAITWDTVPYSQGISVNSTDTSKIEFTNSGKYYMHFSCLLESNSGSNKEIWIFPRINGTDVAGSTIYHTLSTNGNKRTLSKGGIFDVTAGDYLQAMFAVDDTNLRLTAQAATSFAPSAPSTSIEIIQLSQ